MARTSWSQEIVDTAQLKIEEMLRVADIIQIAQKAKPAELVAIKAGLDEAFGNDWRQFKPLIGRQYN